MSFLFCIQRTSKSLNRIFPLQKCDSYTIPQSPSLEMHIPLILKSIPIENKMPLFSQFFWEKNVLGGGNSNIFGIFTPKFGEDEPILTNIFFKWVGSTTSVWFSMQKNPPENSPKWGYQPHLGFRHFFDRGWKLKKWKGQKTPPKNVPNMLHGTGLLSPTFGLHLW